VQTSPTTTSTTRRRITALAAAGLALVAAACVPPPPPPAPNLAACPTAGAGQVQVAVVVQGGALDSPPVVCVVVPAGSDGLDALAARAQRISEEVPRLGFGDAFVCGIDGFPAAPACGDEGPAGFSYWNYWTGGSTWDAAATGAGDRPVTQGSVDAWVFGTWDFVTTFPAPPTGPSTFAALTD
jgi:hypothetical protein